MAPRMLHRAVAALVLTGVPAAAVTPVEKVIRLLDDLRYDVEIEGRNEAKVYDEFACFCKDTTKTKSDSIIAGRDNIDSLSAEIAEKTANKEEKQAELADRKADHEAMNKNLAETKSIYAKEKAEYIAEAADLSKAVSSLQSAMIAVQGSKPGSLLQMRASVEQSLALADALGLVPEPKRGALSAFMQVDPDDPAYKFHSQGIVDTLTQLLQQFSEQKRVLDDDWSKAELTLKATIQGLVDKLGENQRAMDQLDQDIEALAGEIAQARENLVNADSLLKDDQLYMKDLTERCEVRAKDWDQRSQLRADEVKAIAGAVNILTSKVDGLDREVNERALLQQKSGNLVSAAAAPKAASLRVVAKHQPVSFLQAAVATAGASRSLRGRASLSALARQQKAVVMLSKEAKRLHSKVLTSLAVAVSDDPFLKIKTLIQKLVERLLAEATSEATKKGFCDEQLGKARKDRDYRLGDAKQLDVEVQSLEVKLLELEEEIRMLTDSIAQLNTDLTTATELRKSERAGNLDTMKKSKEGFEAVDEALKILKVFYKQAAKAKVLLQASPVDEDTAGAGFAGAYRGNQEASKGILGMLEVIRTDFDRTDRSTEAAEQKAHEEFVEFDRVSRADIAGKETKKALDEEDAETTRSRIAQSMNDLKTAQNLLDGALRTIEDLKPTCIDTGMSFEERVAKREQEIAALKNALCILDEEGVEADCQQQQQGY